MRILYLTQWFDPEPVIKGAGFVNGLIDAGHDVDVLTAFPNYPGGKIYEGYKLASHRSETFKGISVSRVFVYPSHDQSSIGRALNYVSFFVSALVFLLLRSSRYDVIYVYHPPILPALAAALSGIFRKVPFVIDVQDLWPDSVEVSGMANPFTVGVLKRCCNFVYSRASAITCQSEGMHTTFLDRGLRPEKLTRIYNWSTYNSKPVEVDGDLPLQFRNNFKDRFNIVYGGNLGKVQELDAIVVAANQAAKDIPELRLHLVGGGIEADRLKALIASLPGDNVRLYDPVSRAAMDRIFEAADVLCLHLRDSPLFEITIPSKTQHYLAVGKPIVAGISGEAATILQNSGAALVSTPGDISGLSASFLEVAGMDAQARRDMGQRGKEYYTSNMSMRNAINQTVNAIEGAIRLR